MYERAAHEAGKQSRLHSGSAHLPGAARLEGEVEEPSPDLLRSAVLTVVIVALAMVALVVAL